MSVVAARINELIVKEVGAMLLFRSVNGGYNP